MNALFLGIAGLVSGIIFGLLVAYGWLSPLVILIGMAVLLLGAFYPTMFRPLFATATFGFLLSWLIFGGLGLL